MSLCAESGYRVLVKYTPDGGHIKVFSYGTEKKHVICFQDDGIGISKETLEHIFDEYCQEDPSRPGKGIGLGLSVCKKIADLHGFTISVSSRKGSGSVFSVHIPKQQQEPAGRHFRLLKSFEQAMINTLTIAVFHQTERLAGTRPATSLHPKIKQNRAYIAFSRLVQGRIGSSGAETFVSTKMI
ncbi:MAG: sensor histidine kinase [Clostridia bacterium]|nr:sensor histidine kinase [Clostridia bacterium]